MPTEIKGENKAETWHLKLIDIFNKHSKKFLIGIFVLMGLVLMAAAGLWYYYGWNGRVIANINGEKITQGDVKAEKNRLAKIYTGDLKKTDEELRCISQDRLIEEKVVLTEAKKNNVTVSDDEVLAKYNEKIKESGMNEDAALATLSGIYSMNKEEYKENLREQLQKEKLKTKFLREYDLTYIMVRYERVKSDDTPDPEAIKAAEDKIKEVKARLEKGEDLVEIGKEMQADPKWAHPFSTFSRLTKMNEGKLKTMTEAKNDWEGIKKLSTVGEYTDIIKSDGGYHVIYRTDKVSLGSFADWDTYKKSVLSENQARECSGRKIGFIGSVLQRLTPKAFALANGCVAGVPTGVWTGHRADGFIQVGDFWDELTYYWDVPVGIKFHSCRSKEEISSQAVGLHLTGLTYGGSWSTNDAGVGAILYCAYDYYFYLKVPTGYSVAPSALVQDSYYVAAGEVSERNVEPFTPEGANAYTVVAKPINTMGFSYVQFKLIKQYTLTVNVNPVGAATPEGSGTYGANSSAVANFSGWNSAAYDWNGWTGDCTGTVSPFIVLMNGNKTCTANFTSKTGGPTYPLTVTKNGTGTGTVTSSPNGISCGADCTENYNSGTSVTLTALPASGSTFGGWGGACSGTSSTCTVVMTQARNVTATFNSSGASVPTCSITADPENITSGGSSLLKWTTTNATSISASWTSQTGTTGETYVNPDMGGSTTYTMNVYGPGGSNNCSKTVTNSQSCHISSVTFTSPELGVLNDPIDMAIKYYSKITEGAVSLSMSASTTDSFYYWDPPGSNNNVNSKAYTGTLTSPTVNYGGNPDYAYFWFVSYSGIDADGNFINGCSRTIAIQLREPYSLKCSVSPAKIGETSRISYILKGTPGTGNGYIPDFNMGDGTPTRLDMPNPFFYSYASPGIYTVTAYISGLSPNPTCQAVVSGETGGSSGGEVIN